MATLNLLYKDEIKINDKITINIPTVGEVIDNEDEYYTLISMLTASPIHYMLALEEVGVDFTTINDFDLFLLLFGKIREMKTWLVFKDLDMSSFKITADVEHGKMILRDDIHDITIDRMLHMKISNTFRKLNNIEKDRRKPGNKEAREYMMQRAREKAKRKKRMQESQLEQQVIALVNTEQFNYRYDNVRDITIYQFSQSVRQIQKKIDFDHKMLGIYTGNVDPKKMSQDELNWLTNKN